ncbi:MAG TPA: PIG-L family deacetylase [Promineifilum sp.]|nr:PIG-L family deacetylase [Promineifilum sp.]HRQ12871.1 PIG-L family deacetylase [Promineifilum sp.]
MEEYYDHLYISAHFDDVSLSCGGQIFRHTAVGDTVLVVTLTGEEPAGESHSDTVRSIHRRWFDSMGETIDQIVARRRTEDRAAFDVLRAEVLHLNFLDAIYRAGPDGAPLYPGPTDMFGPFNPADAGVIDAVAAELVTLPEAGQVYLPLGVGNHIDHGVARRAGERVFRDVAYYEDYPYTMAPGALAAVLPLSGRGDWQTETIWLTEAALAAKVTSVGAYQSQLSSFFTGPDDILVKLREEGQRVMAEAAAAGEQAPQWAVGAECLWRRRSAFTLSSFEQ